MQPYYQSATGSIYQGHVLEVLRGLPDESVQLVCTSPPYWGLRDYGIEPQIWDGEPGCEHEWGEETEKQFHPQRDASGGVGGGRIHGTRGEQGWTSGTSGPASQGSFCLRCGAWRGSLGLEPTPELFVQHIVQVFREVRRVLRKDGVLFLNLGDSYAANRGSGASDFCGDKQKSNPASMLGKLTVPPGLKPKDLVGIPWRVARALQEPYYTGKIKNEADRIWLAAMIDGEGCMFIHKRKAGTKNYASYTKKDGTTTEYDRKQDNYGAGLEVANTHESIIKRCLEITRQGSICRVERESKNKHRNIPLYRWSMRSNQCREVIREVYPYLVGKKHEARLLLGCPSTGPEAEKAHISLIALHNGREATIDFPPPESMYEPGFYLRSDIIWSKLNPMPESVTDRPTKSHEYIFLLTKSAKYYWDAEAVREPQVEYERTRRLREKAQGLDSVYALAADGQTGQSPQSQNGACRSVKRRGELAEIGGRNLRSVWTMATQPFPSAHFATFPEAIPERCIKAGTSEKGCCPKCGEPWERVVEKIEGREYVYKAIGIPGEGDNRGRRPGSMGNSKSKAVGFRPACSCGGDPVPCVVLDPFGGAGTVGLVAEKLNRHWILIELNPEYCAMARDRILKKAWNVEEGQKNWIQEGLF